MQFLRLQGQHLSYDMPHLTKFDMGWFEVGEGSTLGIALIYVGYIVCPGDRRPWFTVT